MYFHDCKECVALKGVIDGGHGSTIDTVSSRWVRGRGVIDVFALSSILPALLSDSPTAAHCNMDPSVLRFNHCNEACRAWTFVWIINVDTANIYGTQAWVTYPNYFHFNLFFPWFLLTKVCVCSIEKRKMESHSMVLHVNAWNKCLQCNSNTNTYKKQLPELRGVHFL